MMLYVSVEDVVPNCSVQLRVCGPPEEKKLMTGVGLQAESHPII